MLSLRSMFRTFLCLSATKDERDKEMNGVSYNYDEEDDKDEIKYLPEECITRIISFTSAVCAAGSMSLVSQMFNSAANSDGVWERFLPSDIDKTVSELFPPSVAFSSKKELFVRLCQDPVLIDEGKKIFALEKHTGKKCYMIAARELKYGKNSKWWSAYPGSRFSEVLNVRWFDIQGRIETTLLSPRTTYAIFVVFKLKERDIEVGGRFSKKKATVEHIFSKNTKEYYAFGTLGPGYGPRTPPMQVSIQLQTGWVDSWQIPWAPQERANQWMEIEIGHFFDEQGDDGWFEIRLWEVNPCRTKYDIFVEGIELRPKETKSPFA